MNLKKHILVVSQYFYPEQFRINDMSSEWVKKGYKVTVLTGIPNYPQGKFFDGYGFFKKRHDLYNGVDVIRIPLIPRGNSSVMLALNYLSFVVSGFFWKVFTRVDADYVFIFEVSPMTQALPGVWYAKKKNIPCYLYVQDLWPENVEIVAGIKNKSVLKFIGNMVDYIYARCSMIFTTSKSFIDSIHDRGVPLSKLEYWPQYTEEYYVPMEKTDVPEIPNDDMFNVIFTGNIGVAQGLDTLPKAAQIIKSNSVSNIRFNIVGDGRYKDELMKIVNSENLKDFFNFIPKQPATRIPELIAASDVAFLSLMDNPLFAKTIPAKLQSYLACGIPIVAAASGETAKIISESNSGLCGQAGNAQELAENIINLSMKSLDELGQMGKSARLYYDKNFDKTKLFTRMDSYFTSKNDMEEN